LLFVGEVDSLSGGGAMGKKLLLVRTVSNKDPSGSEASSPLGDDVDEFIVMEIL
jgi:hypothetical protein